MKRTFKKTLGLIFTTIFTFTAISCGANTNSDVVLNTVSILGDGENEDSKHYYGIIEEYENKYDITVSDESNSSTEEWKTEIRTSFQIEDVPDVLLFYTGSEAETTIALDRFVDIDTIREEYPEYASNINEAAMSFMVEPDGEAYAVPVRGFWEGLFVNVDLFEEYGLELPTTWDKFIIAIETFEETDITPISASVAEPHYWIEHLILAYGGVEEHRKTLTPGEGAPTSWAEGLNLVHELNNLGAFHENVENITPEESRDMFINKEAAMILEGSWFTSQITDQVNTTVISFPAYRTNNKKDTDIIGGFSFGFYITDEAWEDSKKREAAVKFVEEMTSTESIEKFASIGGAPAAVVEASSDLSQVAAAGVNMSANAINIEMPIDTRISRLSWNYILSNVAAIADGDIDAQTVLNTAANLNN